MNYFLWHDGKERGPYDEATIENSVNDGSISPKTLGRRETDTNWEPIESVLQSEAAAKPSLYLWLNRKAEGPFLMDAVHSFYCEGQITTQTFARRRKDENWNFLSNFYQPPNYHVPYCGNCREYVRPQVVAHNTQKSSPRIAVPVGDYGYVMSPGESSETHFTKFCSICGERVCSQADADANARTSVKAPHPCFESEEAHNRARLKWRIFWLGLIAAVLISCAIMIRYAAT